MTEKSQILEIDKCVTSRLWYTAWMILRNEIKDKSLITYNREKIIELEGLIRPVLSSESPWQTQWIAWKLLEGLGVENSIRVDHELKSIEFKSMLKLIDDNIQDNVEKELIDLFNSVCDSKNLRQKVENISPESLTFLETNLEKCPKLACCIIQNLLCVWSTCFADSDSDLQNLYFNILKKILNPIDVGNDLMDAFRLGSEFSQSTNKCQLSDKNLGTLLSILSRLELSEANEKKLLDWLYPALLKTCNCDDVELALYARKSTEYLKDWYRFLDDRFARCEPVITSDNASRICNAVFNFDSGKIVSINSKELSLRVIRLGTHWVTDVLDICYTLISHGDFDNVSAILSIPVLQNLWPALLFKFLNDCPDIQMIPPSQALRFILDKCDFRSANDPALERLNATLKNQLDVVEWISKDRKLNLDKGRPENINKMDGNLSVKHILTLLRSHSVLSVINMTTNIHESDHEEIKRLLINSPESTSVFQAYCAMLSALKSVFLCENYGINCEEVGTQFSHMESILESLSPLALRLETIENIFSMLFLRYEDFNNAESNSEESEGETHKASTDKKMFTYEYKEMQKYNTGFICNKYTIRELLHRLKNSVLEIGMECAKLKRETRFLNELEIIQKKVSALSKALADATWRLELLTSSEFIQDAGLIQETPKADISEIILNERINSLSRLKNNSVFYKQEESSSDEGDIRSEVDISTEACSVGNNSSNTGKRKKHLRNSNWTQESATLSNLNQKSSIVNFMLATRESLVAQCLWIGNFEKAQQVIKMFNMNNSPLDGEVRFSKAMRDFRLQLKEKSRLTDSINSRKKGLNLSTLQNIRQAVQEGIQTSRLTGHLETFLESQKTSVRLMNPDEVNTNEILTMAVLDLALTTGRSHQISTNLCDVANKYLKTCRKLEKTSHSAYFAKVYQLMCASKLDRPLSRVLCDASVPLSVKAWKEKMEFWAELIKRLESFKRSQSIAVALDPKYKKDYLLPGRKSFTKIIALCNGGEKYLHKVYSHLKALETIIPKSNEGTAVVNETRILENSLDSYFGHQIFESGVEPGILEAIASKLQVNLVHSILVTCCPRLAYSNEIEKIDVKNNWGCVVLNRLDTVEVSDDYSHDPNKCVNAILSQLLQVICDLNPMKATVRHIDMESLSKKPEIKNILLKTSRLAKLDLSELSVGNETLAFFLNAWNLLFLHSMLTIWASDAPCNGLRHTVSLMTIGYRIGELGLVTLAALRSKLLGSLAWDLEFFTQTEELNEPAWQDLDLTQDPRVIFAMANEFFGTPIIRVYDSETLDENLNTAARDYFGYYPVFDAEPNSDENSEKQNGIACWLPELVKRYQNLVSQNTSPESHVLAEDGIENQGSLHVFLKKPNSNLILKYKPKSYRYEMKLYYFESDFKSGNSGTIVQSSEKPDELIWQSRNVDANLLQYLEEHCWLLSYLVQRIHEKNPTISSTTCDNLRRTECFENLLTSPWAQTLKHLFNEKQALAGMRESVTKNELWDYFTVILEENNLRHCLEIVNALPDKFLLRNVEIQCFKHKILTHLVSEKNLASSEILMYLQQIKDVQILAQTVLANIKNWPADACENALAQVLHHSGKDTLPFHCKLQMNEILCRVTAFHRMLPYCTNDKGAKNTTWYDVAYCTEKTDPVKIIKSLIDANKFELCLEWLEYHAFTAEIQSLVTKDLLIGLLENDRQDFKPALKLLQALPINQSVKMCKGVLRELESIRPLKFIIGYLLDHCKPTETVKYHKYTIGVEILDRLCSRERLYFVHLIKEPLLMLEQLLMNGKFEHLQRILNEIKDCLPRAEISLDDVDKIARYYAGKSLDFRVALQRETIENKPRESCVSGVETDTSKFVMPFKVPTKEEWVPNDKARECNCCKAVVFSMFNRRHHCRRCGRVVCAVCSQQRMRVPGYPDSVHVRVCDDCKRQTTLQQSTSIPSSEAFECWRLTIDQTHNQTLRDEFSFEHAPSVSLCLAILNLHSDHMAYASFLLDRCDEMKKLLQPVSGGRANPEVDHVLLIKMIRSLLVAAKVKCAKLGLNAGLAHCDRFLSHVDLVTTLVQSDCSALIPSDDLDDHAFRRFRDLLTEKEQWTLALDVSTKSGLERQGVWAAWGKACLKVGCFDQARDKFLHCLDKVSSENFDDCIFSLSPSDPKAPCTRSRSDSKPNDIPVKLLSISESPNRDGKRKARDKKRPAKDPPLLTEILQILENANSNKPSTQRSQSLKSSSAQEVLNTLSNLKAISQGRYNLPESTQHTKTVYYEESLHYLLTFGSHSSILEFFVKHEELAEGLAYTLKNEIDPELFFNGIYLLTLKTGVVEKLHECMRAMDASLLVWKSYLVHTCHSLERKKFLNTLYQLQIFMKDYVRASMTCIKFYVNEATNYADLCSRSQFLIDAQKHLETELQMQNFGKKRSWSVSSSHSGHTGLTMELEPSEIDRHINTISRQMEVAKFLGNGEKEGRDAAKFLNCLSSMENESPRNRELPTLFGTQLQKTQLAVLAILCGRDVEEGFGTAFRIIQDYNLRSKKVYSLSGHVLALEGKISSVEQLVKCCRSSGAPDSIALSDRVLAHCVKLLLCHSSPERNAGSKDQVDIIIRLITDIELKISMYVESRQLKAAYLLAVKYSRAQDVRRILKEADRLGQNAIKAICTKWLQQAQK